MTLHDSFDFNRFKPSPSGQSALLSNLHPVAYKNFTLVLYQLCGPEAGPTPRCESHSDIQPTTLTYQYEETWDHSRQLLVNTQVIVSHMIGHKRVKLANLTTHNTTRSIQVQGNRDNVSICLQQLVSPLMDITALADKLDITSLQCLDCDIMKINSIEGGTRSSENHPLQVLAIADGSPGDNAGSLPRQIPTNQTSDTSQSSSTYITVESADSSNDQINEDNIIPPTAANTSLSSSPPLSQSPASPTDVTVDSAGSSNDQIKEDNIIPPTAANTSLSSSPLLSQSPVSRGRKTVNNLTPKISINRQIAEFNRLVERVDRLECQAVTSRKESNTYVNQRAADATRISELEKRNSDLLRKCDTYSSNMNALHKSTNIKIDNALQSIISSAKTAADLADMVKALETKLKQHCAQCSGQSAKTTSDAHSRDPAVRSKLASSSTVHDVSTVPLPRVTLESPPLPSLPPPARAWLHNRPTQQVNRPAPTHPPQQHNRAVPPQQSRTTLPPPLSHKPAPPLMNNRPPQQLPNNSHQHMQQPRRQLHRPATTHNIVPDAPTIKILGDSNLSKTAPALINTVQNVTINPIPGAHFEDFIGVVAEANNCDIFVLSGGVNDAAQLDNVESARDSIRDCIHAAKYKAKTVIVMPPPPLTFPTMRDNITNITEILRQEAASAGVQFIPVSESFPDPAVPGPFTFQSDGLHVTKLGAGLYAHALLKHLAIHHPYMNLVYPLCVSCHRTGHVIDNCPTALARGSNSSRYSPQQPSQRADTGHFPERRSKYQPWHGNHY